MTYKDIYSGTVQAFVDQIPKLQAFQDWVGAADETEAAEHVFKYYFPTRPNRSVSRLSLIDLGQDHLAERSLVQGNGRDYNHTGSIVWLLRQDLDGVGDNVDAYVASTEDFLESVSKIQKDLESIVQISTQPSNLIPMTVEMQGWWRPEEEEEGTEGDFLEWYAVITYARDS